MDPLAIEDLAQASRLILRGSVLSKTCLRDPQGRIYTRVELGVVEVWKGSLVTNRFMIVHGGGSLGGKRAVVPGQVEYNLGEEVVVFLVLNQRGEGVTRGLAQGKFRVWKDGDSGEWLAENPFHGRPPSGVDVPAPLQVAGSSGLKLVELKRRVQGVSR
jgi:hypothetical protein